VIPAAQIVLSSFGLIVASEMGDKTQILAFTLAARYKAPWSIMAGILVSTLLNHALASVFGQWAASHLNPDLRAIIVAATFMIFGIWMLKADRTQNEKVHSRWGPFVTTTVLYFLAEMGDKTQIATVMLAAKYDSVILVTLGTTLGLLFADGLAVFFGRKLAHKLQMRWIRIGSACLFFVFGISTLAVSFL